MNQTTDKSIDFLFQRLAKLTVENNQLKQYKDDHEAYSREVSILQNQVEKLQRRNQELESDKNFLVQQLGQKA